jgi:hypothetical protein
LRRLWSLVGWFLAVDTMITVFGPATAPLLLFLAADSIVGLVIIRCCTEMQATTMAVPDGGMPPLPLSRRLATMLQQDSPRSDC